MNEDTSIMRRRATAAHIGVHVNTLYNLRKSDPTFPEEVRITRVSVGWRRCDIDAWLKSRQGSGSSPRAQGSDGGYVTTRRPPTHTRG